MMLRIEMVYCCTVQCGNRYILIEKSPMWIFHIGLFVRPETLLAEGLSVRLAKFGYNGPIPMVRAPPGRIDCHTEADEHMKTEQFEITIGELQQHFLNNADYFFLCSALNAHRDHVLNATYDILNAFKNQLPEFCKEYGFGVAQTFGNNNVLGDLIDDTLFLDLYNGRKFRILVLERMVKMYGPDKKLIITESIESNDSTENCD